MSKKTIFPVIQWGIAALAYIYLTYRLATYPHYNIVADSLRAMDASRWLAMALCVALMPVNMALEAWRWRTLVPMDWAEAQRQVYYSKLAGIVTPWRLGEYPARGIMQVERDKTRSSKETMTQVLSMGAVGSATMTMAIVLAGVVGIAFSPAVLSQVGGSYLYALMGIVLVLGGCLYMASGWLQQWFRGEEKKAFSSILWRSLGQSFVRLGCWCVQLALVLYALKAVEISDLQSFSCWLQMPVYYLLVTITPNIPVAEVGVRGAWSMLLFGTVNAALAGVVLWGVNTLLPCVVWLFLRKKEK